MTFRKFSTTRNFITRCICVIYNFILSCFLEKIGFFRGKIRQVGLSQGSISNILNRMRKQSDSGYEEIRQRIEDSNVVGADETGVHINGKLHWMWVFCIKRSIPTQKKRTMQF